MTEKWKNLLRLSLSRCLWEGRGRTQLLSHGSQEEEENAPRILPLLLSFFSPCAFYSYRIVAHIQKASCLLSPPRIIFPDIEVLCTNSLGTSQLNQVDN